MTNKFKILLFVLMFVGMVYYDFTKMMNSKINLRLNLYREVEKLV